MTAAQIIAKFELYYDDGTALSSQEELDLLNKIYQKVCANRPWEFLRNPFTGTQATSVPYIALPTNFGFLFQNHNYTDQSYTSDRPVIFVGTSFTPYEVVSYADRRQYRNQDGYAYIDIVNSRLYFTLQPTSAQSVEFDYANVPATLSTDDTPVFPSRFHDIIYHGMIVDQNMIEMTDKGKSYAQENQVQYTQYLHDLAYWNSQLIQM